MEASIAYLIDQLKEKGIRPSIQRIKVLEYMVREGGHPTAEEIFTALAPVIPSLSKVTVYNTLHTFVQAEIARVVEIDGNQTRYDIIPGDHGHFLCAACGTITNFPVNMEALSIRGLDQFKITQKNVYYKGLCPNCIDQPDTLNKEQTL